MKYTYKNCNLEKLLQDKFLQTRDYNLGLVIFFMPGVGESGLGWGARFLNNLVNGNTNHLANQGINTKLNMIRIGNKNFTMT